MLRIICALLAFVSLFSLVACSDKVVTETPVVKTDEVTATTEAISEIKNTEESTETTVFEGAIVPEDIMEFTYTVYVPNENADGFIEETVTVTEVSPDSVLKELQSRKILPPEVQINFCSNDDGFVTLDFNHAFADAVCSTGTSGELMIVGSVVNTYLNAFGADSIYFTVDGEILESGHTVYDFVMSYFLSEDA